MARPIAQRVIILVVIVTISVVAINTVVGEAVSAFDEFMLLERKPILTQVEQDEQEAMQYPVCMEAPMILSSAQMRRNHAMNVCAGDYSRPSIARCALPIAPPPPKEIHQVWSRNPNVKMDMSIVRRADVNWGQRSPNVRKVRAADGVVEYHIDLSEWKHNP